LVESRDVVESETLDEPPMVEWTGLAEWPASHKSRIVQR